MVLEVDQSPHLTAVKLNEPQVLNPYRAADTKRKKKRCWKRNVEEWEAWLQTASPCVEPRSCIEQHNVHMGSERRGKVYKFNTTNLQEPQGTDSFLNHECQVSTLCCSHWAKWTVRQEKTNKNIKLEQSVSNMLLLELQGLPIKRLKPMTLKWWDCLKPAAVHTPQLYALH